MLMAMQWYVAPGLRLHHQQNMLFQASAPQCTQPHFVVCADVAHLWTQQHMHVGVTSPERNILHAVTGADACGSDQAAV